MEDPRCATAHLAWIASEVGSATGFPNRNIILQNFNPTKVRSVGWWTRRTLFAHSERKACFRPPVLI